MQKITLILLSLLSIGLAALWIKQRSDYHDLKDQRRALRQEVEDLKIQRDRAQAANSTQGGSGDPRQDPAKSPAAQQASQLHPAQVALNQFIFRGLQPGTGQHSYWEVIQVSRIPDPAQTVYKDCLVGLKLKAHPHVKWKAAASPPPDRIITGLAWGFQDRVLGPVARVKTHDVILCEAIAEVDMGPGIKSLQLVDEIGDPESERFYLAHLEATGMEPVRAIPINPPFDRAPTREAAIAADGQHLSVRSGQLGTEGAGQGKPHGAEAVGNETRVGLVALVVAGDPHLVGAHIRQQDVVRTERLAYVPQRLLGPNQALGVVAGVLGAYYIDPIELAISGFFGVQIFDRKVYLFDHIPAVIDPVSVGIIVFGAFCCTLLFAAIPAWRASRLNPLEALRYE